jgi:hypothetical protein
MTKFDLRWGTALIAFSLGGFIGTVVRSYTAAASPSARIDWLDLYSAANACQAPNELPLYLDKFEDRIELWCSKYVTVVLKKNSSGQYETAKPKQVWESYSPEPYEIRRAAGVMHLAQDIPATCCARFRSRRRHDPRRRHRARLHCRVRRLVGRARLSRMARLAAATRFKAVRRRRPGSAAMTWLDTFKG